MINIFIGYDSEQNDAYEVLKYSLKANTTVPLSIQPLKLTELGFIHKRERDPAQSTEFSFTRFLCPYLSDYKGWCLFMDCDMLNLADINKLWGLRDERYAVQVVKHEHSPTNTTKFLGRPQKTYACKNWSSLMLMNNSLCQSLTPEYVDTAHGLELHQFKWIKQEQIGELPNSWNHLVDILPEHENINQLHYTEGGPWFDAYKNCGFADLWFKTKAKLN